IGLLRGLENIRLQAEPFTLRGEVQRLDSSGVTLVKFNADSESEKYRIRVDVPKAAVAMFDGDILYCFDGRDSAVANIVSNRSSYSLAFDPRTIGITTGLFNDLTLHENIAYHSGSNFSVSELDSRDKSKLMKRVSLRDRFGQ